MTITHRQKSSGSTLNASSSSDTADDKETLKYHCDGCTNDVTNTVRIRCADPSCPDFDLCVTCFCGGVEGLKHKTWHDYRIVKPHSFPIFTEDWDADEELLLIEAAEKNGIGNWQTIAEVVGTKSKEECEKHYLEVYVESPHWPLPRMDLTFEETSEDMWRDQKRIRLERSRATLPGNPSKPAPPPPANSSNSNKPITSGPAYHEVQGYMPRRFEFETEHENDAEQFVKDMTFNEEDTQEEMDLKIMVLDIYNSRLDRRIERKKMIFERGWLDYKKQQALERKRQKEERDIHQKTRVFCRLQTPEDYEMLVQGLVKEQQLRDRIATLQEWRQAGLTSFRQGEQYEQDKQDRLGHLKTLVSLSNERMGASARQPRNTYRAQMAALSANQHRTHYYKHKTATFSVTGSGHGTQVVSAAAAASGGRKPANPLDIGEADGVHLLTEEEQVLCSTLRIMPRPYLVIKDTILKEYARLGYMKRRQARSLIKIDVNKTSRIFDFFVESGWIKAFRDPMAVAGTPHPETPTHRPHGQPSSPLTDTLACSS
ncbi:hypothetical protein BDF14DRAFT_1734506 [Spinellus fusiger]|nr:hypothetical protein BDF14DRAFT_1734506 [Spinellus fusiger]